MPAEVPLPLKPRSMLATSQPPSKVMPRRRQWLVPTIAHTLSTITTVVRMALGRPGKPMGWKAATRCRSCVVNVSIACLRWASVARTQFALAATKSGSRGMHSITFSRGFACIRARSVSTRSISCFFGGPAGRAVRANAGPST